MKVVTAIENFTPGRFDIKCFLAGGITKCWNWQEAVINELNKYNLPNNLVIFNPRRENFPIDDPRAAYEQISWEFYWLERCDIFSMYFARSESVQPICMYELGRNLARMRYTYRSDPGSYIDRVVITCEDGYSRAEDVLIQSNLALGGNILTPNPSPESHAEAIYRAYATLYAASRGTDFELDRRIYTGA